MIMHRTRTGSFPLLADRTKGDLCQILIILVHGFRHAGDKSYKYGVGMENWLEDLMSDLSKGNRNVAHVFRFDMGTLLLKGTSEFEKLSSKLHEKVHKKVQDLRPRTFDTESRTEESSASANTGPLPPPPSDFGAQPEAGDSGDKRLSPVLIFIAHGFGCWLVRDMLGQKSGTDLSARTRGIIPLDCLTASPHRNQVEQQEYKGYLERLAGTFSLQLPKEESAKERIKEDLSKTLRMVDDQFKDRVNALNESNPRGFHAVTKWVADTQEIWFQLGSSYDNNSPRTSRFRQWRIIRIVFSKSRRTDPMPQHKELEAVLRSMITNHNHFQSGILAPKVKPEQPPTTASTSRTATLESPQSTATVSASSAHHSIMGHQRTVSHAGSETSLNPVYNSPRDSLVVFPKTKTEFDDLYKQAKSFISRAEFKNADILCKRAINLLPKPTPGDMMSEDRLHIEMQRYIITLLSGNFDEYAEVTVSLTRLKQNYKALVDNQRKIRIELNRWIAESFTLRGEYAKAVHEFDELPGLNKETQKLVISASIKFEEEDITALRDLALTFAYLGYFTRAQIIIGALLRYIDRKRPSKRQISTGKAINLDPSNVSVLSSKPERAGSLENKRDSVLFVGGVIHTLSGSYPKAAKMAEEAWEGRKARLGGSHVKTLEAATLWAHLLALTSRVQEAENVCTQTLRILSATELGLRHPRAIRAMKTLVFILRTQFRLVEAVDTGYSLCKIASDAMTDTHPETLKARAELASALRSAGNYEAAELTYTDLFDKSEKMYPDDPEHPQTLQYQSELVHVYACIGRLEKAENLGLEVAWKQRHAYQFEKSNSEDSVAHASGGEELTSGDEEVNVSLKKPKLTDEKNPSERLVTILDDLEFEYFLVQALDKLHADNYMTTGDLNRTETGIVSLESAFISHFVQTKAAHDRVRKASSMKSWERIWQDLTRSQDAERARDRLNSLLSELRIHPSLLHTMQILGWVKLQKQDADSDLTRRIIDLVRKWRIVTLGKKHDLTLVSEYDLAVAERERGDLDGAQARFHTVFTGRRDQLGESHPDTLSAKRELIVTRSAMGAWENPDTPRSPSVQTEHSIGLTTKPGDSGETLSDDAEETTVEPQSSDTALTPPVSKEMTLDDWTEVERASRAIAEKQENRAGPNHPETINTLVWVFAVELLTGKIKEASQTMHVTLGRLQDPKVQEQRLLSALLMQERIAWICLEQDLVGYAMDILDDIKKRIAEAYAVPPRTTNNTLLTAAQKAAPELIELGSRCSQGMDQIRDNKDQSADELLKSAGSEEPEDAEVYLINLLRLAHWTPLGDSIVREVRSMALKRCGELVRDAGALDNNDAGNQLKHVIAILNALFPNKGEQVDKLRADVSELILQRKQNRDTTQSPSRGEKGSERAQETMDHSDKALGADSVDGDEQDIMHLWKKFLQRVDPSL